MKVVVALGAEAAGDARAAAVAESLAGHDGASRGAPSPRPVSPSRPLSAAEVDSRARGARAARRHDRRATSARGDRWANSAAVGVVAVTDHVNLTWRSPLTGTQRRRLGPRFPSMTGIYAPEIVSGAAARPAEGIIVTTGVVAGVPTTSADLTESRAEMVGCPRLSRGELGVGAGGHRGGPYGPAGGRGRDYW